jgi:hypothetical protein
MGTIDVSNLQLSGTIGVQPLDGNGNALFPFDITAGTAFVDMFLGGNATAISHVFTSTVSLGIYQSTGASLTLLNSCTVTFGLSAADANASLSFTGSRFLSIHSSQWSSAPVFKQGSKYFMALGMSSAGTSLASMSLLGIFRFASGARAGTIGANSTASFQGESPFYGIYASSTGAFPGTIANSELNKSQIARGNFVPHIIFTNNASLSTF